MPNRSPKEHTCAEQLQCVCVVLCCVVVVVVWCFWCFLIVQNCIFSLVCLLLVNECIIYGTVAVCHQYLSITSCAL